MKSVLDIQNLSVEFKSPKQTIYAVRDVSLKLYKDEILGIVGESGSGKTALAKSLTKQLPKPAAKITSGQVYYEEKDLLSLSEKHMQKNPRSRNRLRIPRPYDIAQSNNENWRAAH